MNELRLGTESMKYDSMNMNDELKIFFSNSLFKHGDPFNDPNNPRDSISIDIYMSDANYGEDLKYG